jgi:hypothetical protein
MFGTLISALVVCVFALLLGQAVLRLCGADRWSWLAPAVGMCVLMLGAIPALHLPGRSVTVGVLIAVAAAACAVVALRNPAFRPPTEVLAGVPTFLLALVPFGAADQAGTLGVSLNNDMASHLRWAEAYGSEAIAMVNTIDGAYPLGPHAVVAAITQTLGIATEEAFAGLTLACPVLLAWTALCTLPRGRLLASTFVATLVGMPFIVAGYYGQGSFKELLQAVFVLALVGALLRREALSPRFRWVPPALLVAGMLSVYSVPGLAWPAAIVGVWVVGLVVDRLIRQRSLRGAMTFVRAEIAPLAIGVLVLLVLLIPQGPRLERFFSSTVGTNATGIETTSLGNLVGRLPVWEAFGAWDNPDYRLPPFDPFTVGMWTALVLALVLVGAVWWVRKGDWIVPAAAAASLLIWVISDRTQSPYVSAKALVVLSPMLMLLAARPLVEAPPGGLPWSPRWRLAAGAVAVVLGLQVIGTSWDSLRVGPVGPRAHLNELRELRPLLDGRPTLFLGNDDFIRWELAGVPVNAPVIGFQGIDTRPEKPWEYGQPFDFDSLEPTVLNEYDWIITPRDAAGSDPPEQLRLERSTRSFQLWRRVAPIEPRAILAEGPGPAAPLDCSKGPGRRLSREGGVAAVRAASVSFPVSPVPAGGQVEVPLTLSRGLWELQAPYISQHSIEVTAPGLRMTLPANLDRPGTRWPIGRIEVTTPGPVVVTLRVDDGPLTLPGAAASINEILATPVARLRLMPLRKACGKLVDWYRPA